MTGAPRARKQFIPEATSLLQAKSGAARGRKPI